MTLKIDRSKAPKTTTTGHSEHSCMAQNCNKWGSRGYSRDEAGKRVQLWFCPEHAKQYEVDLDAARRTPPPPRPPKQGRLV
ncbi:MULTISPECIES: hypothetical protein [unclassified Pseudovibrio]|uniref:hypothetical protein n=1 Tax=unclassified Pseudovibrio TaxID=2627060 RepID=UPI0007AEB9B3|nr:MULTISPECIES: hypothetical protein [unclassified Pseudovibrio]KZL02284.1 hypothetical protein PsW74_01382 [Pseudovibrio sp. W74]KZL08172.1 hypothetical protein PsAD14_03319 [Pseudovibrio sp. Ad14]